MLSESARMATTAELRFRVQAPNSQARATAIVAIDAPGEFVVRRLAEASWQHATFLTGLTADGALTTLGDRPTSVRAEVDAADQVIMVVGAGGQAEGAEAIGRACSLKRVTTTALIVGAREASEADLSKTLVQLRPWSLMVVIANSDDYVADMMAALRV